MRYGIFAASRLASVAFCDGVTLVCYYLVFFYRTLVAKLPVHQQKVVLDRFTTAFLEPAVNNFKETARGGSSEEFYALKQVYEQEIAENWPRQLKTLAMKALKLSIDMLLLKFAPLALEDKDHPVMSFLGGPPPDFEADFDKGVAWYNAAHTIFYSVLEYVASDDANLTRIWAAGPEMTERVLNVLGVDHVPFRLFAGSHVPKEAARDLFVKQGGDTHPTVVGSSSQDVHYRFDREAFPIPVLRLQAKVRGLTEKYAWAPLAEMLSMDPVHTELRLITEERFLLRLGHAPFITLVERFGSGGCGMKKDPGNHINIFNVLILFKNAGPFLLGITDHDRSYSKSSTTARVFVNDERTDDVRKKRPRRQRPRQCWSTCALDFSTSSTLTPATSCITMYSVSSATTESPRALLLCV